MSIPENKIREDIVRFVRHEAMLANCLQDDIIKLIQEELNI